MLSSFVGSSDGLEGVSVTAKHVVWRIALQSPDRQREDSDEEEETQNAEIAAFDIIREGRSAAFIFPLAGRLHDFCASNMRLPEFRLVRFTGCGFEFHATSK